MPRMMEAVVCTVVHDEEEEANARLFLQDMLGPEWVVMPEGVGVSDATAA